MTRIRLFVVLAALGLAAADARIARAGDPGCTGPGCFGKHGGPGPAPTTLFQGGFLDRFHKPKLPVFQAAPWYQYWPYDAHFLTPAPVSGAFYGPPLTGNFPVNPYFPGPAYGFGPGIPGGPPAGTQMMPGPGGGR